MLDKTTHPFIVNTLRSSPDWELILKSDLDDFKVELGYWHEDFFDPTESVVDVSFSKALDRLESVLAGRQSE
jgi:hypothetical protein